MAEPQTDAALDDFLGKPPPSFWSRYGKWIAITLGVLLLLYACYKIFGPKPVVGYQTQEVAEGDLAVTVTAVGNLAPTNQVTVGSQISGLIARVLVDVNDKVAANQPVALIDPTRLDDTIRGSQAQLAAQRSQIVQARATVAETKAQLGRLQEVSRLSGGRVPSKTEMQTAQANTARAVAALKVAEAQTLSAQAQLSIDKTQRSFAVIRSPVSGVILSRQVDPGQTVAASFNTPTLFTIAEDLSRMKLDVAIDEADVGQVKQGQKATFTVDAFPGQQFPANITRVNLGATGSTSTSSSSSAASTSSATAAASSVISYTASLSVANPDQKLRPGMTATATIAVTGSRGLLVPNAALRFTPSQSGGKQASATSAIQLGPPRRDRPTQERTIGVGSKQTIYVLGEDGTPKPISVMTGETDGRRTVVSSPELKAGMKVVTGRKAAAT